LVNFRPYQHNLIRHRQRQSAIKRVVRFGQQATNRAVSVAAASEGVRNCLSPGAIRNVMRRQLEHRPFMVGATALAVPYSAPKLSAVKPPKGDHASLPPWKL